MDNNEVDQDRRRVDLDSIDQDYQFPRGLHIDVENSCLSLGFDWTIIFKRIKQKKKIRQPCMALTSFCDGISL